MKERLRVGCLSVALALAGCATSGQLYEVRYVGVRADQADFPISTVVHLIDETGPFFFQSDPGRLFSCERELVLDNAFLGPAGSEARRALHEALDVRAQSFREVRLELTVTHVGVAWRPGLWRATPIVEAGLMLQLTAADASFPEDLVFRARTESVVVDSDGECSAILEMTERAIGEAYRAGLSDLSVQLATTIAAAPR